MEKSLNENGCSFDILDKKEFARKERGGGKGDNFKKVAKENFGRPQLQIIDTHWHIIHIVNVT